MAQSLQMRATSLGASALLLGAALIGAASIRYVLPGAETPDAFIIAGLVEPPPPPPTQERPKIAPPPEAPAVSFEAPTTPPPLLAPVSTPAPTGDVAPSLALVTNPTWVRRPADLERYYPRRALQMGVEGSVSLDCRVLVSGNLACAVIGETPPNWGFAQAALRIAGEHRMVPATRDGVSVEGRYVMRVPFAIR